MKSCDDCVFRLDPKDYSSLGENLGGPICGRGYGPLFMPSFNRVENGELRAARAENCVDYNTLRSAYDLISDLADPIRRVITFMPDPNAVNKIAKEPHNFVHSCLQCQFYIPPETMVDNGMWNVGACSVRGILLRKATLVGVGSTCDSRTLGTRDDSSLMRMQLMPEYTLNTIGKLTMAADFERETVKAFAEPATYPTDAPVTKAEIAGGVRAWRKVMDERKERSIMLPIFDVNFFSEEERAAIPRSGDDEHPEEYIDHMGLVYKTAVLWMALDETPALWGAAGTGKTEFFRHMAWIMCLPFHRISVTGSTEVDDLAGKMHYDPARGTYFEYGRIPTAWGKPGVICLDEPNVGQPDVWQFIRPLTDNSKQLVLDMNKGERMPRHDYAFLGMAMNPAWDIRNSGTATIADADGSRLMHIYVDLPNETVERKIISARVRLDGWDMSTEQLDMVIGVAADLRRMSQEETLPITWGIRPQIKVARALKWFSPTEAYRLATADYLEPAHQELILDVVRSHARSIGVATVRRATVPRPGMASSAGTYATGGLSIPSSTSTRYATTSPAHSVRFTTK